MDSIKWKYKNWMVYLRKFDNFHVFHVIVKNLDVFNFHPIFCFVISNCYCCHTHVGDLNTFFKSNKESLKP